MNLTAASAGRGLRKAAAPATLPVLIGLSKRHLREGTLPAGTVIPVAKALYLCDGHIAFPNRKTDLMGIFTSIRPASYPHVQKHFVIYAQLISGLGQIPFYFDVRLAATG